MLDRKTSIVVLTAFSVAAPGLLGADPSAYPARLTLIPKATSPIVLKVLPKSTCVLHAEGENDPEHSLKLFADDTGLVRFQVQAQSQSDQISHFQVDCEAEGESKQFPLELRPNSSPTTDMPLPPREIAQPPADAPMLPALSADDAALLSVQELRSRGYPPRPDPQQAPDAYAVWLRAVTKPARIVNPRLVPNPGVTHRLRQPTAGLYTNNHWSGYELHGPANSFDQVTGTWTVPTVVFPEINKKTYSTFWIGIDGDGLNDLVQEGTEQDIAEACLLGACFTFTNYYAWTEILPEQETEQVTGNFNVYPGDEIYSIVSMCAIPSSSCFYEPNAPFAAFWMMDLTHPQIAVIYDFNSNGVVGTEAEWIMERPSLNGSFPDLAAYIYAFMSGAYACNKEIITPGYCMSYLSPLSGFTTEQIWMYNGNDLLSEVIPINNSEMEFLWVDWH